MNIPEFAQPPRAIAIDLDGTLLNSQTQLSERNHRALERCLELGIPVIIATSRPARIFDRIFPPGLRQKCSYILMNGAITRGNPPLAGYHKQIIAPQTMREIIEYVGSYAPDVRITIEIDGYDLGTNWQWDPVTLWQRNSARPDMVFTLEEAMKRNPCKIAIGNVDVFELSERLEKKFGDSLSIITAKLANPLLNITTKNATKPVALQRLLTPYGISLDEVLAFGDDLPDLDMLKSCGISVTMANAFPEVKAVCRYETAGNDEDGVAVVLEKLLHHTA